MATNFYTVIIVFITLSFTSVYLNVEPTIYKAVRILSAASMKELAASHSFPLFFTLTLHLKPSFFQ